MGIERCALHAAGECGQGWHGHHVIPKQRLRRAWERACGTVGRAGNATANERLVLAGITRLLADRRNIIPLCGRHHHRITHGWDRDHLLVTLAARMPALRRFAEAFGLENELELELSILRGDRAAGRIR